MIAFIFHVIIIIALIANYKAIRAMANSSAAPGGIAQISWNLSEWLSPHGAQWRRWAFLYVGTPVLSLFWYNIFWWVVTMIAWTFVVRGLRRVAALRFNGRAVSEPPPLHDAV